MSVEEDDVACLRLDIVLVVPHTLSDKVSTQVIYKTVSRDNAAAQVACFIGHFKILGQNNKGFGIVQPLIDSYSINCTTTCNKPVRMLKRTP